jgi:DNA-binding LacI/PurR family transcriptional regulator
MNRLTIIDVARLAGVSPTAVSLAMNGKPGISEKTREKILSIISQVGFIPNESSRRLLLKRTGNVAILMSSDMSLLDQAFYAELNIQILRECENSHYNVIYCIATINGDEVALPNVIKSRDVDGILIMGYLDPRIINRVSSYECPVVIVDNSYPMPGICNVLFDYKKAAVTAMEYLIRCGHRKIGYIGSDIGGILQNFSQQTFEGYKSVLGKHQLSVPASWMQMQAQDERSAFAEMDKILKTNEWPTAILCSGDIYAIGAMKCIKARGLKIPDDISVIGIDDILLSQYVDPSLTTIRVDRKSLAEMAVSLLVSSIRKIPVPGQAICDVHQLVERQSVKK